MGPNFTRQPSNKLEKVSSVEDEAAGQRVANSDSVHTARYNQSLCDCQLEIVDAPAFFHAHEGNVRQHCINDSDSLARRIFL